MKNSGEINVHLSVTRKAASTFVEKRSFASMRKQTEDNKHIPVIDYNLLKGMLCIFVVIGHCQETIPNGIIQIIYWFHMPCFFMLSGWLGIERPIDYKSWRIKKVKRLIVPQIIWFIILTWLQGRLNIELCWNFVRGARNIGGVYWFVPVFFADLLLFEAIRILCGHFRIKMDIVFLAVYILFIFIQYYIWEKIELINVSFSIGIMLLCIVYMYIGYRLRLLYNNGVLMQGRAYLRLAIILIILMVILYKSGIFKYRMNLAFMVAGTVGLNLIVPCAYMVCMLFISTLLSGGACRFPICKGLWVIRKLGESSLLVMYLHKYILNDIVEVLLGSSGYMWIINVTITIGLLLLVLLVLSKLPVQIIRMLGGNKSVAGQGDKRDM